MNRIFTIQNRQHRRKALAVKFALACCLFSLLMICDLVNKYDPIDVSPFYPAGDYELSSGRWAIRFWDYAHLGLQINPFVSLLSLAMIAQATNVLAEIFDLRPGSMQDYAISLPLLSSSALCAILSYRYTSSAYCFGVLLAVLCARCIQISTDEWLSARIRPALWYLAVGMACFAWMTGIYQTNMACAALIVIFLLLSALLRGKPWAQIWHLTADACLTAAGGMVLYFLALKFELLRNHIHLSDYNGIDSITPLKVLQSLGVSGPKAWHQFFGYFAGTTHKWNVFVNFFLTRLPGILPAIVCIAAVAWLVWLTAGKNRWYGLAALVLILLIPFVANITVILAPGTGIMIQQSIPEAMLPGLILALILSNPPALSGWKKSGCKAALYIAVFLLIWGSAITTLNDQQAMKEGLQALETMNHRVAAAAVAQGEDLSEPVYLVGIVAENPLIVPTECYEYANEYARVAGSNWPGFHARALRGVASYRQSWQLNWQDGADLNNQAADMPVFPAPGSIARIDGKLVVKLSDTAAE